MALTRILLIICFAIPFHMNAQTESRILSQATLHIDLELIPVDIADSEWDATYSIELTRAIKRDNLPAEITISIDKHRYRKEQVDQEWGWKGKSIEIFDLTNDKGWYCKSHPLLKGYIPFSPALPGEQIFEEEVDEPVVELLDEHKKFLGLDCRKARWTSEEETWNVWYAEGVTLEDDLEFIWGLPGIPGLILEMAERPEKGQVSTRLYKVKSVDETVPEASLFETPTDYHPYESSIAARKAVLALLQQSYSDSASEIDHIEGPWQLSGFPDEMYLKVEVVEDKPVLMQEIGTGKAVKLPILIGEEGFLQVNGLEFKQYQLGKKGKRLDLVGKSAFRFRKVKEGKFPR